MNLIATARAELAKARARFYELLEPEKEIAAKVEAFAHSIADHVEAEFQRFEARIKALEEHMHAVTNAPAIASDVTTFHPPAPAATDTGAAAAASAEAPSPPAVPATASASSDSTATAAGSPVPQPPANGDAPRESAGSSSEVQP